MSHENETTKAETTAATRVSRLLALLDTPLSESDVKGALERVKARGEAASAPIAPRRLPAAR